MDTGIFRRCKTELAIWLLLPPMLCAVWYGSVLAYAKHVDRALVDRRALAASIRGAESVLDNAIPVLQKPFVEQSLTNGTARLVSSVDVMANKYQIHITSLRDITAEVRAQEKTGLTRITLALNAEAYLGNLIEFMAALRRTEPMMGFQTMTLKAGALNSRPRYAADCMLHFYELSDDVMKAPEGFPIKPGSM